MKTTTDTESKITQINRARFSYLQLFFHIITTIRDALLPAMNKSLYAALVKVCTSRGKPLSYSCNDSIVVEPGFAKEIK
jgi:hypothetical protein